MYPRDPITHLRGLSSVSIVPGLVPTAAWDSKLLPPPLRYLGICSDLLTALTASYHPRTPDSSEWARLVLLGPYSELRNFQIRLLRLGPAFHANKVNELVFVMGSHTNVLSKLAGSVQLCTSELGVIFTALSTMDGQQAWSVASFIQGVIADGSEPSWETPGAIILSYLCSQGGHRSQH